MTTWYKWTHCFVEWEDEENWHLSVVPWHIFLWGWATNFPFKWVAPWKISFDEPLDNAAIV